MNANKRKILNDPLYGFVKIPNDLTYDVIQHPYFQRLRHIKQLGLTDLVYPGAMHTRFQHAIGAMHLMNSALNVLMEKGILIMDIEKDAALLAILLHDIGHGPFSHVLEYTLMKDVPHELLTELIIEELNLEFNGSLALALQMFKNEYPRTFFHDLISSQLDMDRLDYLNRDSFFTGVIEGRIGVDRIIKMLNVVEQKIVVEDKGLLSIESFLNARRLMYWQVYLHKTAVGAEVLLTNTLKRAAELMKKGVEVDCSPSLAFFLQNDITKEHFKKDKVALNHFLQLDDADIWMALKNWQNHDDEILSYLSTCFIQRNLFKTKFYDSHIDVEDELNILQNLRAKGYSEEWIKYLMSNGTVSNSAYLPEDSHITIFKRGEKLLDLTEMSELPSIQSLSKIVKKHYLCYPNDVYLQPN